MTRRILGRSDFLDLCGGFFVWGGLEVVVLPGLVFGRAKVHDLLDYFFLRWSGDGGVILALRGSVVHPIKCGVECEGLNVEDADTNEMGRERSCTQCWVSRNSE